jgi:hypothetical protein
MPPRLAAAHLAAASLALLLGGCTLVDQRTFQPRAAKPGAAELAAVRPDETPLLTVRLGAPLLGEPGGPSYGQALDRAINLSEDRAGIDLGSPAAEAVRAGQARNPDAVFDVLALVPTRAAPAEQDRRVTQAGADALTVANSLAAAGVPPARLRLGLRGDPGNPPREVRVYAR